MILYVLAKHSPMGTVLEAKVMTPIEYADFVSQPGDTVITVNTDDQYAPVVETFYNHHH